MKNLRYNGNISSMQWQNGASAAKSGYKFSYDGLNRLTSAIYGEGDDMSQNADRFSEKGITYNANGSIYRMKRYGMLNDGSYGLVDDLKIKLDGNALYGITDYAAETNYKGSANFVDADGSGQEYWFNGNGSLSADANKGIARIDYDNYGCPRKIVFINGNTTEYVYSSTGEKLRTTHKTAIDGITVALNGKDNLKDNDFLSEDKTDYHGSFIYENGKLDKVLFQGGYVQKNTYYASASAKTRVADAGVSENAENTDNGDDEESSEANCRPRRPFSIWDLLMEDEDLKYTYHYYTQDHLGNNRAVINEFGIVRQVTNYYPFGGVFSTTAYNSGDDLQPYKYNGKELDRTHGLDWYDYGARNYDATLCQFTTIDPLCEKYYHISPYAYCANNPVNAIDPSGKLVIFVNGKIGGGSPEAGEPYWNGRNSTFVKGAIRFFKDRNLFFSDKDYGYLSSAQSRMRSGYDYAKSHFSSWKKTMRKGETVKLVSHSMGGAFSKGVEKFLKEKGLKVEYNVMINTYQVDDIPNEKANETIDVDYQNTDDPVLFWFDDNLGYGELENSDYSIREESNEGNYYHKHRSPIDSNAQRFWELIKALFSTNNCSNE